MNWGMYDMKRCFTKVIEGVAAEDEYTSGLKVSRTFLHFSLATNPSWSQE